jgi:DNA replication and repair protein RecF
VSLWNHPRLTAALCTVAVLGCAAAPAVFLAAADAASLGRVETVADPYVAPTPTADDYYILRQLAARSRNAESEREQRPGRTGKLNGADVGRAAALAGNFQAVVFEPDLLGLVKGGPDGRRRFMDSALCQVYRPYLVALRRYMRLTAQKNALLKSYDITPNGNMLLDTYDEQLAEYGALIMEHRCKFLAAAAPIAAQNYRDISHGAEVLALNYQMCTAAPTAAALTEKMRAMRSAELRAGFCLAGPHREDLEILLDGQPARVFGSQGQQRSCVLAMKLAEATVVGDLFGEHPVLLLDDVLSELDDERQTYLLTRMGEHQTIVTTCDTAAFARTNGKIVMVKGGVLEEA